MTLPEILILSTGGTIASEIRDEHKKVYTNQGDRIAAMLRAARVEFANVRCEEIASLGSQDMNFAIWRRAYLRLRRSTSTRECDGVVITHGTDTLEETAFLLDLVCEPALPVVLTASMRASNAPGADGPRNLVSAMQVAADPAARGRGVLVVLNDTIYSGRSIYKARTSGLDAFAATPGGIIGAANPDMVSFQRPPEPRSAHAAYDLPQEEELPAVAIVYCHADMELGFVEHLLASRLDGLIVAGLGDGNIPAGVVQMLGRKSSNGMFVVRSTRINEGEVPRNAEIDDDSLGFIAGGRLNPQKCRLLLQILLSNGITDREELQRIFDVHLE